MHILNHTQGVKLVKMQVPHKKKSLYIVNLSLLGQLTINLSTCFSHSILLYMYCSLVAKKKKQTCGGVGLLGSGVKS